MSSVHGLKRRRRRGAAQADRTLPILVLSVILGVGTMQVLKSIFGDDGPSKPAPAARADPTTAPAALAPYLAGTAEAPAPRARSTPPGITPPDAPGSNATAEAVAARLLASPGDADARKAAEDRIAQLRAKRG